MHFLQTIEVIKRRENDCESQVLKENAENQNGPAYRRDLDVGDWDVEKLVHLGVPDHPHVCYDCCAEIALEVKFEDMFRLYLTT